MVSICNDNNNIEVRDYLFSFPRIVSVSELTDVNELNEIREAMLAEDSEALLYYSLKYARA